MLPQGLLVESYAAEWQNTVIRLDYENDPTEEVSYSFFVQMGMT